METMLITMFVIGSLLAFIGIVFGLAGQTDEFATGSSTALLFSGALLIVLVSIGMLCNTEKRIDLPEEIIAVTFDKTKPDTLITYQTKDSVIIRFSRKP